VSVADTFELKESGHLSHKNGNNENAPHSSYRMCSNIYSLLHQTGNPGTFELQTNGSSKQSFDKFYKLQQPSWADAA
jgi:hypothetical protein